MFGWFRRNRRVRRSPSPKAAPRACLSVEGLEERWNPAAPSIMGLTATRVGDYVVVQGSIMDESPSLATVALTGAVSAQASRDGYASFSYYQIYSSGTEVTAQATDIESLQSSAVTATITQPSDANPFVTGSIAYGQQRSITVSGRVIDESPSGLTVNFGGVASGSTTTDSGGFYSVTLTASQLGSVSVWTTDAAFHPSNNASVKVESSVPDIQNFYCTEEEDDGWYLFSGQVMDESPGGLVVYFGGAPISLAGKSVTVQADGWFYFSIQLNGTTSDNGTASAWVTDWWDLMDMAYCDVHQT